MADYMYPKPDLSGVTVPSGLRPIMYRAALAEAERVIKQAAEHFVSAAETRAFNAENYPNGAPAGLGIFGPRDPAEAERKAEALYPEWQEAKAFAAIMIGYPHVESEEHWQQDVARAVRDLTQERKEQEAAARLRRRVELEIEDGQP